MQQIVVGVDGSACAQAALDVAVDEAKLRGAKLHLVCAWQFPGAVYGGAGFAPPLDDSVVESVQRTARGILDQALERVHQRHPDVSCDGEVVEGQAASAILSHAGGASLIVVGNRGHGGFGSLLLGSVSQQIVHHANCPVLVVREGVTAG